MHFAEVFWENESMTVNFSNIAAGWVNAKRFFVTLNEIKT